MLDKNLNLQKLQKSWTGTMILIIWPRGQITVWPHWHIGTVVTSPDVGEKEWLRNSEEGVHWNWSSERREEEWIVATFIGEYQIKIQSKQASSNRFFTRFCWEFKCEYKNTHAEIFFSGPITINICNLCSHFLYLFFSLLVAWSEVWSLLNFLGYCW